MEGSSAPGSVVASRSRPGSKVLFSNALRRERSRTADSLLGNDNGPLPCPPTDPTVATAARFRRLSILLVLASSLFAVILTRSLRVRVDPHSSIAPDWTIAALLLASRVWWDRNGKHRIADASGTVAVVALGGMSCGTIAMLELRLGFPLADGMLRSFDHGFGVDCIAIVSMLVRLGHWVFWIMAPAYNFTIPVFFAGVVIQSLLGDRIEAWRAAFCFVGTLLTTCVAAIFTPAKGLGVWAPETLLAQLPEQAMRTFWPHFDEFYYGANPVLRLQEIDGVISFPSFHAVVGFLVLAMWRKNIATFLVAGTWLAIMLLATLPGGGHYFVDLLAGFVVWAAWFALSRYIERQTLEQLALAPA